MREIDIYLFETETTTRRNKNIGCEIENPSVISDNTQDTIKLMDNPD